MHESTAHSASRVIIAPARAIFRAFLDAEAVASWRPPKGMTAKVFAFDPRVGGGYRMAFFYPPEDQGRGKSTVNSDIFSGRFTELIPNEKLVEQVEFESSDAAFTGPMTVTTTLV